MATTQFFPVGTNSDGVVNQTGNTTWATLQAGSGTNAFLTDDPPNSVYYGKLAGSNFDEIDKAIYCFSITAIGTDTISAGSFNGYVVAKNDQGSQSIYLDLVAPTDPTSLVAGDYVNTKWSAAEQATTHPTIASISTSAYMTLALSATGLASATAKRASGYLCFGVRGSGDFLASAPTMSNGEYTLLRIGDASHTGTSQDPYVELTYAPAAGTTYRRLSLLGAGS